MREAGTQWGQTTDFDACCSAGVYELRELRLIYQLCGRHRGIGDLEMVDPSARRLKRPCLVGCLLRWGIFDTVAEEGQPQTIQWTDTVAAVL